MKKECQFIIRELKKIFPDADHYSASAEICSWINNCKSVRYTAHAHPEFCAVMEPSPEAVIALANKAALDIATNAACETSDASSNNIQ